MTAAIDFDDEALLMTGKVCEISADRRLPAKVCALHRELPEIPPQLLFRIRHVATQAPRARDAGVTWP